MELILSVVLMIAISIIAYNIVRKKNNKPLLERTMSVNPNEVPIKSDFTNDSHASYSQFHHKPCVMTTILKIVGVINTFAGIIVGIECSGKFGTIIALCIGISGIIGCLFGLLLQNVLRPHTNI